MFAHERLRVGVTGHRLGQLPQASRPALRSQVEAALTKISSCVSESGHGYTRLALVSALAEGADRYAAHAALALGWRLIAPLPFSPHRYEKDFGDAESVAEFRTLLKAAQRRIVHDGEASERAVGDAEPYAAVGRVLAELSNVLVAVWNGAPPKGPGGTAEVAARALDAGKPVIWIAPDGAFARLILPQTSPNPRSFRFRLHIALEIAFERVARPPDLRIAAP